MHDPNLFSIADAARRLNTSYWKLYGLHREGALNLLISPSGRPVLTREDLEHARVLLEVRRRLRAERASQRRAAAGLAV
jgi:hypothetical protein